MVNVRHFITRKSVVAFQTLMKAMLGEWTTTHERIVILDFAAWIDLTSNANNSIVSICLSIRKHILDL